MIDPNKAKMWSLMTPFPVVYSENACYWKGIGLGKGEAILLVSSKLFKIWATPTMKDAAYAQFLRAVESGEFGDISSWKFNKEKWIPVTHINWLFHKIDMSELESIANPVEMFFEWFGVENGNCS